MRGGEEVRGGLCWVMVSEARWRCKGVAKQSWRERRGASNCHKVPVFPFLQYADPAVVTRVTSDTKMDESVE